MISLNRSASLTCLFFLLAATSCFDRQKSVNSLYGELFSFDFEYQIIMNDTIFEKSDFKMTPLKLIMCKDSLGCPICLNNILTTVSYYLDRCNTFDYFDADSIGFFVIMSALPEEMQNSYLNVDLPYVYLLRDVNDTILDLNDKLKGIGRDYILLLDDNNYVVKSGDFLHDFEKRKEFENEIMRLLNI